MGERRRRRQQRARERAAELERQRPRAGAPDGGGLRRPVDRLGGPVRVTLAVLAAVLVAALLITRLGGGDDAGPAYVPRARGEVDGRSEGSPDAPVTIIEFSDFQCPFCRSFALLTAEDLAAEFIAGGVVRLEYRHFAFLDDRADGEESKRAAAAAECAGEQGFFWEYHDILFQKQGAENSGVFSDSRLRAYAAELAAAWPGRPFEQQRFDACLASGAKRAVVEADRAAAEASGVVGTPTFFINGRRLEGAQPLAAFREAVAAALASIRE